MLRVIVNPKSPESVADLAKLLQGAPAIVPHLQIAFEGAEEPNGAAPAVEPRYPLPQWKKHTKGKARSWTATWERMALRVEREITAGSGIVFNGYVDHDFTLAGKSLVAVRLAVAMEALRRRKLMG